MGRRVHHLLTVGAGYKEGIESQIHNWLILKSWDITIRTHFGISSFSHLVLCLIFGVIKDYTIIPLVSLDNRRNAFINITNLIWSSSNGLG